MKEKLKSLYRFISPRFQTVHLDYKVEPKPRQGHGKPAHSLLYKIIDENRELYKQTLYDFLHLSANIHTIQDSSIEKNENLPAWNNEFLPGLDIVGLYGVIAMHKPKQYIEIGSGNSTKVARKAISDLKLDTKITSIDPYPRANIDHLADKVIREPFEKLTDLQFIINSLNEGDILFIDNSHRCFSNSDATVCFLELLPFLKKGVIVHVHDIYLPYDYPQFMCDRFYNEQYVLAAFILANPSKYKTILPNYFISEDKELSAIISPMWNHSNLKNVERHGGSYWLMIGG
jgi:hypothetical protein